MYVIVLYNTFFILLLLGVIQVSFSAMWVLASYPGYTWYKREKDETTRREKHKRKTEPEKEEEVFFFLNNTTVVKSSLK